MNFSAKSRVSIDGDHLFAWIAHRRENCLTKCVCGGRRKKNTAGRRHICHLKVVVHYSETVRFHLQLTVPYWTVCAHWKWRATALRSGLAGGSSINGRPDDDWLLTWTTTRRKERKKEGRKEKRKRRSMRISAEIAATAKEKMAFPQKDRETGFEQTIETRSTAAKHNCIRVSWWVCEWVCESASGTCLGTERLGAHYAGGGGGGNGSGGTLLPLQNTPTAAAEERRGDRSTIEMESDRKQVIEAGAHSTALHCCCLIRVGSNLFAWRGLLHTPLVRLKISKIAQQSLSFPPPSSSSSLSSSSAKRTLFSIGGLSIPQNSATRKQKVK